MVAVSFGDTGPHAPLAVTVSGQGAVCLAAAPSKVSCLFPTAAFSVVVSLVLFGFTVISLGLLFFLLFVAHWDS